MILVGVKVPDLLGSWCGLVPILAFSLHNIPTIIRI
jgi:hypothetical protein